MTGLCPPLIWFRSLPKLRIWRYKISHGKIGRKKYVESPNQSSAPHQQWLCLRLTWNLQSDISLIPPLMFTRWWKVHNLALTFDPVTLVDSDFETQQCIWNLEGALTAAKIDVGPYLFPKFDVGGFRQLREIGSTMLPLKTGPQTSWDPEVAELWKSTSV